MPERVKEYMVQHFCEFYKTCFAEERQKEKIIRSKRKSKR